jgi:hypothetical protein
MSIERAVEWGADSVPRIHDARTFREIPLLEQATILIEREGGLTECFVPAHLINHEEVPVKEEWAESLARQMRDRSEREGGSGQKTPIQLGWIAGESTFRIVDGFHRDAALVINGETMIFATVEHTDWDKLFDDRIVTAKDHAHVRFSRVVRWMKEVWEHTGLGDKISLEQALLLYRYESSGVKLGLTPEEAVVTKEWIARKEQRWELPAMTIHGYLQTAERVDPELVNSVREKKNSRILEAPTQQIIKTFSEHLPDDFELQNLVWLAGQPHNLNAPKFRALCDLVRGREYAQAQILLNSIDIASIKSSYGETKKKQTRRASDPRFKGATVLEAATTEIERVNERVQRSIDRNEEVDDQMLANLNSTLARVRVLQTALDGLAKIIAELKSKNTPTIELQSGDIRNKTRIAYQRHLKITDQNKGREPNKRSGTNSLKMNLPTFGKFYPEEWASLAPHHRFALVLDHSDIATGTFDAKGALYIKLLELADIITPSTRPKTSEELRELVRAQTMPLVECCPFEGRVITVDKETRRPVITPEGRKYLTDVVKNALLEVDDTKVS